MSTLASPSCNTSTLAPYVPTAQDPWDMSKVKHVYRRLGFSASESEIDAALALSPDQFIDDLVDSAYNLPLTPTPPWGYYNINDFTDYETENEQYIYNWRIQTGNDLLTENLRGRITFFWMNHFVTELETYYYSPYLFQYYNILQANCLGNFKNFVHAIGINSTMLYYLNGFQNTNVNPNENYARELFELFTLGEGNGYTENDITETARALTGYNHWDEVGGQIYFDISTHDTGSKIIFGQEGTWGYGDVIDILFQERGQLIAEYICDKLYKFFVSPSVDAMVTTDIIQPLAQTLMSNNFELIPTLKELFKSEHFFNEFAKGTVIKSPFDVILGFVKETEFFYNNDVMNAFIYYAALMGQELYDPPDVAGWQRDEDWISTSTLTARWQLMELYVDYIFANGYELQLTDLAKALTNNSNDPEYIAQVMVDHFTPNGFNTPGDYITATDVLKWEVPQNYYDNGQWNLDWSSAPLQVALLIKFIVRMPEFQLK